MFNAFDVIQEPSGEVDRSARIRTLPVLLMLVTAAATVSYLAAYAVPDALAGAGVVGVAAVGDGIDPRPHRLAVVFISLLGSFLAVATLTRVLSGRQLRRIDAMSDEN